MSHHQKKGEKNKNFTYTFTTALRMNTKYLTNIFQPTNSDYRKTTALFPHIVKISCVFKKIKMYWCLARDTNWTKKNRMFLREVSNERRRHTV